VRGAVKLVQLDSDRGVKKTKLRQDFLARLWRLGHIQQGREQVSKVQIQIPEGANELLNIHGFGIKQLHTVIDLLPELIPVHVQEWIGPGNLPDDVIGNPRAFAELGEVQLPNSAAFSDVMDQVKGVSFASKKSHVCSRHR
jgi:hypothetical protein